MKTFIALLMVSLQFLFSQNLPKEIQTKIETSTKEKSVVIYYTEEHQQPERITFTTDSNYYKESRDVPSDNKIQKQIDEKDKWKKRILVGIIIFLIYLISR